ncbi:MAG: hypothetical protein RID09_27680 [Coleofasciculus sp. G1-WW12-02]|uniref:hypothetical protein n=1 Tax=Coleofasciculus sp. G1-WW12-02 TaxID=3068483 RepID=UPI0032FF9E98
MPDHSISIGGNAGNIIQGSTVQGNVSAAINELPASNDPEKPDLKELLIQLKRAIETEPSLDDKKKIKALKQVESLAKAAEIPQEGEKKERAEDALTMLKGIFSNLNTGATLFLAWDQLHPMLSQLFRLE